MTVKEFLKLAFEHTVQNLTSIKVWILGLTIGISTLLAIHFVTMENSDATAIFKYWTTFNGGVVTAIVGMREAFKVAKVRALSNGAEEKDKEEIKKVVT